MGNIYTVDSTLFSPDIPTRLDMRTAALVEHALGLQEMAGTAAAALFLHCHDVALETALRVLSTGPRRQSAAPPSVCPPAAKNRQQPRCTAVLMQHPMFYVKVQHSKLSESSP